MKPIGLTLKDVTYNSFTGRITGELMVVHLCLHCGKISTNRIAGDDNPHSILTLLNEQITIDEKIYKQIRNNGVILLTLKDKEMVLTCLFGYSHI